MLSFLLFMAMSANSQPVVTPPNPTAWASERAHLARAIAAQLRPRPVSQDASLQLVPLLEALVVAIGSETPDQQRSHLQFVLRGAVSDVRELRPELARAADRDIEFESVQIILAGDRSPLAQWIRSARFRDSARGTVVTAGGYLTMIIANIVALNTLGLHELTTRSLFTGAMAITDTLLWWRAPLPAMRTPDVVETCARRFDAEAETSDQAPRRSDLKRPAGLLVDSRFR